MATVHCVEQRGEVPTRIKKKIDTYLYVLESLKLASFTLIEREKGSRNCLALYCSDYLENIGFVYPAMSKIIIDHSLLY
jgi:hypothetical protein